MCVCVCGGLGGFEMVKWCEGFSCMRNLLLQIRIRELKVHLQHHFATGHLALLDWSRSKMLCEGIPHSPLSAI